MQTREIACIHYLNEGNCDLGRAGTFYKKCQHCKSYKAKKGSRPARVNKKREKGDYYDYD